MGIPSNPEWNSLNQIFAVCELALVSLYFFGQLWAIDLEINPPEDSMFDWIGPLQLFRASRTRSKLTSVQSMENGESKEANAVPSAPRREDRVAINNLENIPLHFGVFVFAWAMVNL